MLPPNEFDKIIERTITNSADITAEEIAKEISHSKQFIQAIKKGMKEKIEGYGPSRAQVIRTTIAEAFSTTDS